MAAMLSRNRPNPPIFALTDDRSTRMALNLQWGVIPFLVELSDSMEDNITKTFDLVKSKGMVKKEDSILIVSDIVSTHAVQTIQVKTID